jgi:ATP-dependent helicase/DNAse subunit B
MRLLLGPPGSGKTARALQEFCEAARHREARFVVPTATMAKHLQHELARRGAAIPPSWVTTLSRFAARLAPGVQTADSSALALLVGQELEKRPELYPALRDAPGLASAIASAAEELANSGCGALQWMSLASLDHRFDRQFGAIYEALEKALAAAGLRLRAQLLMEAAARVREGSAAVPPAWFDGFTLFSNAELALIDALREKTQLTLTLPEWTGAAANVESLRRAGAHIERLAPCRAQAAVHRIRALSREREVEEIVLQVIDEHNGGRPWREMGVIVRSEEGYLALLERTFGRAGIPARAYFGRPVLRESAGVFFRRFAAAVSSGWDGEAALELLRHPLCRASGEVQGKLWTEAIENLPFRGLAALRQAVGAAAGVLSPFEFWADDKCRPREWAQRLPQAAALLKPPPADAPLSRGQMLDFRLRAEAFRAAVSAAEDLAALLPDEPLPFAAFWAELEDALEEARLYLDDGRRDVVHILDVQEARQWELPVVFVCGLIEGEFPRSASPDPLLPEEIRLALRQQGIPVRTRADREEEERFHFEIARTRATEKLFFSWPERNEKGDPNLRSFVLEEADVIHAQELPARRLRIRARRAAAPAPRPALQADEALQSVRAIHARLAATAVESFLQCPFQFFARHTMQLEPLPPPPSGRLDARFHGTLAHRILAEWHDRHGDIVTITGEHWDRELRRNGLQPTHQTILDEAAMKRHLAAYAQAAQIREGWKIRLEEELQLHEAGVEIHGRADRVDVSQDGQCKVYDFKYSSQASVKMRDEISVQGGLYAEALSRQEGLQPAGIYYVALKDGAEIRGADSPEAAQQEINEALQKTNEAIEAFQSGRIEVRPAIPDLCQWCEFRGACRWQEEAAAAAAAGGEGED